MTELNHAFSDPAADASDASDRANPQNSTRPTSGSGAFLSCEHILEATEACFAEAGYDGTTIRAIATRLGCSVGSIYRYFTDKRDLLRACAARAFGPVARYLDAEAVSFDESLRMYLQLAAKFPQMYRLMFWLECVDNPTTAGPPRAVAALLDGWAKLLNDRTIAESAWATTHGLIMMGLDAEQIERRILGTREGDDAPSQTLRAQSSGEPSIHIVAAVEQIASREDVTLL